MNGKDVLPPEISPQLATFFILQGSIGCLDKLLEKFDGQTAILVRDIKAYRANIVMNAHANKTPA